MKAEHLPEGFHKGCIAHMGCSKCYAAHIGGWALQGSPACCDGCKGPPHAEPRHDDPAGGLVACIAAACTSGFAAAVFAQQCRAWQACGVTKLSPGLMLSKKEACATAGL